ncbi:hypothetical protein ACE1CI_34720 [Aerosakkonemataceae cyanobacterium BLCC-F50]|uniref:Uncharacterized protein n=1 Tax=Floridaenema flaviceps BLCC-F50 TaxID=3153642 RepID=A0ABV4Y3Q8_9CYAN
MVNINYMGKGRRAIALPSETITEEEFEIMVDRLTDEFAKSVGENAPLLSDYAIRGTGICDNNE